MEVHSACGVASKGPADKASPRSDAKSNAFVFGVSVIISFGDWFCVNLFFRPFPAQPPSIRSTDPQESGAAPSALQPESRSPSPAKGNVSTEWERERKPNILSVKWRHGWSPEKFGSNFSLRRELFRVPPWFDGGMSCNHGTGEGDITGNRPKNGTSDHFTPSLRSDKLPFYPCRDRRRDSRRRIGESTRQSEEHGA